MTALPLIDRSPDAIVAHYGGAAIRADVFAAQVAALAERLPERPGYAINLCSDRYAFTLAFAAAIAGGHANLLPANRLAGTVAELRERYADTFVLSEQATAEQPSIPCVDPAVMPDPDAVGVPDLLIEPEQLAAIVFTSGSTGESKPIEKPWRTLFESTRLNAAEMGVDGAVTHHLVATVPPQHMYGLETSVLLPLLTPVAANSERPFTAHDIADTLASVPEPRVLVSVPVHLQILREPPPRLPVVACVFSATAPLDPELAGALEYHHDTRVTEIYGCSEIGSLARRAPAHEAEWTLFQGFTLSAEGEGSRIEAAHLPTAVVLEDRLESLADRCFRLIGRSGDQINVAGKRASLADLNRRLLQVPGVEDGVIFLPPAAARSRVQRPAALVVAPGLDAAGIRRDLRERVDEAFLPRPIRLVEALPRSATGKLTREALLSLFHAR